MLFRSGQIFQPSSTGLNNYQFTTFRPKVIFFWGGDDNNPNVSLAPDARFDFGVASEDGQFAFSTTTLDDEEATVGRTRRTFENCIVTHQVDPFGTKMQATFNGFMDNGFSLIWTHTDGANRRINYLAIGGDEITDVKVGDGHRPDAAGLQAVEVGFRPDFVMGVFASRNGLTTEPIAFFSNTAGIGAYAGQNRQFASAWQSTNNANPSSTVSDLQEATFSTRGHIGRITQTTETGFNVDWTGPVSGEWRYFYVAIKGGAYDVGTFAVPGTNGIQRIEGLKVKPQALMLYGHNAPFGSAWTQISQCFGVHAAGVPNDMCVTFSEWHNQSPTLTRHELQNAVTFRHRTATGVIRGQATVSEMGNGYFDLNWANIQSWGVERHNIYIAFGEPATQDELAKTQVIISGVERRVQTLKIEDNINQTKNTCSFSVEAASESDFRPQVNTPIEVLRDNQKIFSGTITNIEKSMKGHAKVVYDVQAVDHTFDLDRRIVLERYRDTTANEIITNLIEKYAPEFSTEFVAAEVEVRSITFDRVYLSDAIERLAELLGYSWYVDYDRAIHFFQTNQEPAPYNLIEDGNYIYDSLRIAEDLSQLRNMVIVRGGKTVIEPREQTFDGDGVKDTFALAYQYAEKPTVTVGETEQTVGIDAFDREENFDCFWSFPQKYIRFKDTTIPSSGTDNVVVEGDPLVDIVVRVPDPTSIEEFGLHEFVISDNKIRSRKEAVDFALVQLGKYKNGVNEGTFSTYRPGLRSGQVIRITNSRMDIDGDFLIQRVVFRPATPTRGKWEVQVASLRTVGGIVELLNRLLRERVVSEVDQESIFNQRQIAEAMELEDGVEDVSTSNPPYTWEADEGEGEANPMLWNKFTWVADGDES